jgi:hypothetical protein
MPWESWKKGFDAWEGATAKWLESVLKSPLVLGPSGAMLGATMKAKAKYDDAVAQWWATMGLPTRRDQERSLHALNQMQSRILDLEEKLAEMAPPSKAPKSAKRSNGAGGADVR